MSEESTIEKLAAKRIKAKKQAIEDVRSNAEKEIDDAIEKSKLQQEKIKARKKLFKRGVYFSLILLFAYGLYYLFKPFQASMGYGICKTFLELQVRFPQTLHVSSIESFQTSVRLWYVQTDSFGEYKMDSIQCYYKPDPSGALPYVIEKIVMRRREVDPKKVEEFNKVLPQIFANPPDLTVPAPLPDSLQDLQINPDALRRPIL